MGLAVASSLGHGVLVAAVRGGCTEILETQILGTGEEDQMTEVLKRLSQFSLLPVDSAALVDAEEREV